MTRAVQVDIGDQVFLAEGGEEIGAVREVRPTELVVYVEGTGDFVIASPAVRSVHDGKVVLDREQLDDAFLRAAAHAHDQEE